MSQEWLLARLVREKTHGTNGGKKEEETYGKNIKKQKTRNEYLRIQRKKE